MQAEAVEAKWVTVRLRPEEAAHLGQDRCACGHLETLHCCHFCEVGDCGCDGGPATPAEES